MSNNLHPPCPQVELPLPSGTLLLPDQVDVEESLSPVSMSILKEQRSLLAERLQNTSLRTHAGLPSTPLVDFTEVELPRCVHCTCVHTVYTLWYWHYNPSSVQHLLCCKRSVLSLRNVVLCFRTTCLQTHSEQTCLQSHTVHTMLCVWIEYCRLRSTVEQVLTLAHTTKLSKCKRCDSVAVPVCVRLVLHL